MDLKKIKRPTLILDVNKCRKNINKMAEKAKRSGVAFRPHFKTHQSVSIGNWFREEGVNAITVSSVTMAGYFAKAGWKNITIAFPVNVRETEEIERLSRSVSLNILISDLQQAEYLKRNSKVSAGCFIKIDTGNRRSGIVWDDNDQIGRMVDVIENYEPLRFNGFLTHAGQTYKAVSPAQIVEIYNDTLSKMTGLREYSDKEIILSTGDTPSCSIVEDFSGFDEIRPGNFVFYDLTQYNLGSCSFDDIALVVACPVVEKNLRRKEIIIYGGGVHLSKDHLVSENGVTVYGKAVYLNEKCWIKTSEDDYIRSVSQEHGIIASSDDLFRSIKVGDLVGIVPVHSCMTADLLKKYYTFDEELISDFSPK
jgi:D-serine deaminase-like pyridoxal phosphate-dependent protein